MFVLRPACILLCFALLVLLAGCVPKKPLPLDVFQPAENVQAQLRQAELAWQARNFAESARIYEHLAWEQREGLEARLLPAIRERLVQSLLQTRHYSKAALALERWADFDPLAQSQWLWHDFWLRTLLGQGREAEGRDYLTDLMRQNAAAWDLRFAAGVRLVEMHQQARAHEPMAKILAEVFAMAPQKDSRIQLERMAMQIAKGLSDGELRPLARDVSKEQLVFPDAIFSWESLRRAASREPETWPETRSKLQRLLQQGEWADSTMLAAELKQLEERFGLPGLCLGFVLPLDGPLAEASWKILCGAEAAQRTLFLAGMEVRLEVINALSPDLEQQIQRLDAECSIIGGPMQRETWQRIQAAGLHRERAFFAFLPTLGEELQEGRDAWRFFSSPQDQVRALLGVTVNGLGITNTAVLYPEDRFGRHMSELFIREATNRGSVVRRAQSYSPTDHVEWGENVAGLLGVQPKPRRGRAEKVQLPDSGFQALFIPDSLTQAEMLIPHLFYYDERRLLLLGPELWSQAWSRRAEHIETQFFQLAVMPGAWWPDSPSPATQTLVQHAKASGITANFWLALGYDFVRWAKRLGRFSPGAHASLNANLADAADFQWSMAPLRWDAQGVAQQDVYLFQPTSSGLGILDLEGLRSRLEQIRSLHKR
jgi:hypothetical protein